MWDAAGDTVEHLAGAEDFRAADSTCGRRSPSWPDGFITLRWPLRLIYDSAKIGWKIGCSSAPAT
jgi:hypothetical protein